MRKTFPVSSQELNDRLLSVYEKAVYLLGQEISGQETYSGLYDQLENNSIMTNSEIPSIFSDRIIDILKFDYFYRKQYILDRS